MARYRSPSQYAAIALSETLASEFVDNPEISWVIERLRLERKKLSEICEALLRQYHELNEKTIGVLTSAVSIAIQEICGEELAAQISRETRVIPKVPYAKRAMSSEKRKMVSIAGVKAQGKHIWNMADDSCLISCITSAEAQLGGRQGQFWNMVSESMNEQFSIEVSAASCRNREDKIQKKKEAA